MFLLDENIKGALLFDDRGTSLAFGLAAFVVVVDRVLDLVLLSTKPFIEFKYLWKTLLDVCATNLLFYWSYRIDTSTHAKWMALKQIS